MKKLLGFVFLKITGWCANFEVTPEMKHSVMVAAPHTSSWDFPFTLAVFWYKQLNIRYFIKDSYTKSIFGWFFKWTGGIGVDTSKRKHGLTAYAVQLLKEHDDLVLLVPAEGTRKPVKKWRTGFYHIAKEARLPISMGYLDYEKKEAGVLDVFYPTGNFEKDMLYIQESFRHVKPKFPEKYNPQIF